MASGEKGASRERMYGRGAGSGGVLCLFYICRGNGGKGCLRIAGEAMGRLKWCLRAPLGSHGGSRSEGFRDHSIE